MGSPAISQPQTAAPETPQAPAQAPAAPAPAPAPSSDQGAAPAASPAEPGASPKLPPTDIPYPRFREVQTNLTKTQREFEQFRQQQQAEQQKLQQQIKQYETDMQEARDLQEMLNAHPEIAEQLIEAVQSGGRRVPRTAAPQAPALPKELLDTVSRMDRWMQSQAQREQQMRAAQADQQTSAQLNDQLTGLLTQYQYDPGLLTSAREFILGQVARMEHATLDDVPWLFGQWVREMEKFANTRIERMRAGKTEDARLPATPGPAATPVTPSSQTDAFGPETNNRLLEGLRKMGWGSSQTG